MGHSDLGRGGVGGCGSARAGVDTRQGGLYKTEQKIINTHIRGLELKMVALEVFSLTAVLQRATLESIM